MEENKPGEPSKVYRAFSDGREEFDRERLVDNGVVPGLHKPTLQVLAMTAWLAGACLLIALAIFGPRIDYPASLLLLGLIGGSVGGCIGTAAGQMFRGACIGFLAIVPTLLLIAGLLK